MKRLYIEPTPISPEINLSPEERLFTIRGNSSPEDVRALYYPVIEWIELFVSDTLEGDYKFTPADPLRIIVDLHYFNSSSAKFLYDIFILLRKLKEQNVPLDIEWQYDPDDYDQKEAGEDLASLAGLEFTYVEIKK